MLSFKKCFKCNHKYPLFFFPKNFRKYQLSTAKGRGLVCKCCLFKEVINEGSYVKVTLNNKLDKEGKKLPDIIEVIKVDKTIINGLKRVFNIRKDIMRGKVLLTLNKQLKTEYKQDAEDCIKIYNYLYDTSDGHIWESQWNPLVSTEFEGKYPNNTKRYKPTSFGYIFLKGLENNKQ